MEDKRSLPQVGKVSIFKPQVGKMFFEQTTGGQNVSFPKFK